MGVKMGPSRRARYELRGPGPGGRQSPEKNLTRARGARSNLNDHTVPTGRMAFFDVVPGSSCQATIISPSGTHCFFRRGFRQFLPGYDHQSLRDEWLFSTWFQAVPTRLRSSVPPGRMAFFDVVPGSSYQATIISPSGTKHQPLHDPTRNPEEPSLMQRSRKTLERAPTCRARSAQDNRMITDLLVTDYFLKVCATIASCFGLMEQQVNTCLVSMEWSSLDSEQPRILSDRPSLLSL
jgi:hypothetical protein